MKYVSSRRLTHLCIFYLILGSGVLFAQDLDTITISGRVLDANAAVIPGALVQAISVNTGSSRMVSTDDGGHYRLIQLEPGTYILRITCSGFSARQSPELSAVAGQSLRYDVLLAVAGVSTENVTIDIGDKAPVDTRRTVVGSTINGRDVESLPLPTRSILDLVFTLPGITEEPLSTRGLAEDRNILSNNTPEESGTVSLAGAPAYSNNFTIDGLDNNDDRAARERFQPSLEAVDEVQVITNQFSAEYGRASGGRVNLRTRSGTKQFSGRLYYHFRDEALNANTFRNNSLGLPRLPFQEHVAGFTLGGPLPVPRLMSSTLFFFAFERDQVLDSSLIDTLVPVGQNALFPLPQPTSLQATRLETVESPALAARIGPFISWVSTPLINNALSTRIDHQFSEFHSGSVVFQLGRSKNLRQFGGGSRLADSLQAKIRNSHAISYSDTFVLSENSLNQFRVQFSRLAPAFEAAGGRSPVVLITVNDSLPSGDSARRSGTLVAGSSTSGGTDRREERFQAQEVISFVRGNHSLKTGLDVHYVRSEFIDLSDLTGTFNFASAGDFLAGIPSRFRQRFQTSSVQKNVYTGVFVQDEWQIWSKLLISYGLRYERERIIRDLNNFGPRASLAYKPFELDSFVLRLGAGIFYNRALLRTIDDFTLGSRRVVFDTNTLHDPSTGNLMDAAQRRIFISQNLHFPQVLKADSSLVQEFGLPETQFTRRLDPGLRIPASYQVNLGAEQYLGKGYTLETNFTINRGVHLWREFNTNAPRLPAGYGNFSEFLASRDFPNFINGQGSRPIYTAAAAGELVRFVFGSANNEPSNSITRVVEAGVPLSVVDLSSPTSTTALQIARAALNELRPDPSRSEVEQLIDAGNSFYRGLTLELRKQIVTGGGLDFSFRAGYTFSSLVDDGVVNTSDALNPGDFRAERARSLLDRRHRFVLSGVFYTPPLLGRLQLSPIFRVASGAPFNISIGGVDRNLDDVGNDRPIFSGDLRTLRWREPGQPLDSQIVSQFLLPRIGQSGNLPRNAGQGPGLFAFDLNVTREFRLSEQMRVRPVLELDNILNKKVFSFGAEFVDFRALAATASAEQWQSFISTFLVPTRTMRPRQIRVGIRVDF